MKRPAIMGIVNVTPDSFSGDGKFARDAIRHAQQLAEEGADILDIGAESTRPNATPLSAGEEWARLAPVLEGITAQNWRLRVRLSVDTRHAETAARALDMGVEIINDVGGLREHAMAEILEEHECDIVVMHALSIPADPALTLPEGCDVVAEILRWKQEVTQHAKSRGIAPERLIYDAGIGFGKTAAQSLALVQSAQMLVKSGGRWLIGHSRKSFLALLGEGNAPSPACRGGLGWGKPKTLPHELSPHLTPQQVRGRLSPRTREEELTHRDTLTLALSQQLAEAGVDYLRVHNVARHVALLGA